MYISRTVFHLEFSPMNCNWERVPLVRPDLNPVCSASTRCHWNLVRCFLLELDSLLLRFPSNVPYFCAHPPLMVPVYQIMMRMTVKTRNRLKLHIAAIQTKFSSTNATCNAIGCCYRILQVNHGNNQPYCRPQLVEFASSRKLLYLSRKKLQ